MAPMLWYVKESIRQGLPPRIPFAENSRSFAMTKTFRSKMVLAVMVALASSMSFAESAGEATYKAKCQSCHGSAGVPSAGIAKLMGVKPFSDPDIKKLTADQMFASVKNGKGKMQPFKDKLTDAQIKDAIAFFRGLK
jgi:mono/diheme cytochrome c family protein